MDKIKSIAEQLLGNPSKKLKLFARGILALGSLCSAIGGIVQWVTIGDFFAGLLSFLTTAIGGILLTWFSALLAEGYAIIVEKAEVAKAEETEEEAEISDPQDNATDNDTPDDNSDGV